MLVNILLIQNKKKKKKNSILKLFQNTMTAAKTLGFILIFCIHTNNLHYQVMLTYF